MPGSARSEGRSLALTGAAFFGVLVVLIAVVALAGRNAGAPRDADLAGPCASDDADCRAGAAAEVQPGIIPRPGDGRAPSDPGDRGGWAQLAVLGAIVAGLAVLATLVVRSSRRATRATRAGDPGPANPRPG